MLFGEFICFQVFRPRTPPEAIQVVSRLLEYIPSARISPLEACAHAFFDELRDPNTRLPNGRELPILFNFSPQGKVEIIIAIDKGPFSTSFLFLHENIRCGYSLEAQRASNEYHVFTWM